MPVAAGVPEIPADHAGMEQALQVVKGGRLSSVIRLAPLRPLLRSHYFSHYIMAEYDVIMKRGHFTLK
ncbi:hypothetical protein OAK97_02875 [bacterium]|nr:hypothetical protein [bacterium]